MSVPHWLDQSTARPTATFDALVLGGGIAGLSTAYWLQKQDSKLKIAIIEKDRIGFGASGRNAGFVTCGSTEHFIKLEEQFGFTKAVEIWNFSKTNHDLLREHIIEDAAEQVDYRHTGSCTIAPNETRWQKYRTVAASMRQAGIEVSEVEPANLEADYGIAGFHGGILNASDGFIHPVKLLERLRAKLKSEIFEGFEVFALEKLGNKHVVKTDRGVFHADHIFLTLNAYLPLVVNTFTDLIKPGRGQALLTEPMPQFVKGPCYLTKHLCYFRQLPTGHLLVGGFRNLATEIENTYADQTTPLIQKALVDFVREHFKHGHSVRIAYQWSGIMGFSPDGQMLIGSLAGRPGVHVMAGCSGHGMGLSFHAAKTLVGSAFGQAIPSHLQIERFFKP